jgi:hypothetical protein
MRTFLSLFIFAFGPLALFGQTTLVHYKFNDNLNAEAGAIGSPSLTYSITATYNGGVEGNSLVTGTTAAVANGAFVELTITTTGYEDIEVSWAARTSNATNSGAWVLTGNSGSGFGAIHTQSPLSTSFVNTGWISLASAFNDNSSIVLRITANNPQPRNMRIDDLIIRGTALAGPIAEPTIQAINVSASCVFGGESTVSWTNGNGTSRIVKMNTVNTFTAPVDGTGYTANANYSGSGEQVVYNGTASSFSVSGLVYGTTYHFRAYEYNGSGATADYLTSTGTGNPGTLVTPSVPNTLPLNQDFDSNDDIPYCSSPLPYANTAANDIWSTRPSVTSTHGSGPAIFPTSGNLLWAMQDLENPNGGGSFEHFLDFVPVDLSSYTSNVVLTFDYNVFINAGGSDYVRYQVEYNAGSTWPSTPINLQNGPGNTGGWQTATVNVPNGSTHVRLRIIGRFNSDDDVAAIDNVHIDQISSLLAVTPSSLAGFCTTVGTPSVSQSFNLSGSGLTPANGDITVTAPTGFQVSTNNSTFLASVPVAYTGGSLASTPVYVRATGAAPGSPSGNVTCAGGGASTVNVAVSGSVGAALNFSVGDISILGFSSDAPDQFSFVNWVSIPAGAQLSFTDNAWTGTALTSNENTLVWQNNTGNPIDAGTVIVFTDPGSGNGSTDLGTVLSGNLSGISASNDNVFIYEGSASCPEFVFGFSNTPWITVGIPNTNNSYLPAVLNVANGNLVAPSTLDNWEFSAPRNDQSTIAAYKPLVNNTANWTGNDANFTLSSTDFTIASSTPSVELSASAGSGSEAAASVITITATASAPVVGNQTVTLSVSGTGITSGDYVLSNAGVITILNGNTTGTVTFTIVDDSDVEGTEIATLTYLPSGLSAGLIAGTSTSVNITITDNDGTVFYSQGSGGTTAAIWDIVPSGTGQTATSLGGFSQNTAVVIQSGHTVDITTSGVNMLSLTVQSGAKFFANNAATPEYVNIYGNVVNNGQIGNGSTTDLISFNLSGTAPIVFSGPGAYDLGRMRKNTGSTGTVTISSDMNFRFAGACFHNDNNNSSVDLIISSGVTVSVLDAIGDFSIDGINGASGNHRGGSITVNGTLNVSNKLFAISNNIATYPCSMTIGPNGRIKAKDVDINIDGTSFTAFTINSGGILEIDGILAVKGGTLTANNGGVLINSGAQLLHGVGTTNGGGAVSGNVTVRRQGSASNTVYNYWSTPVVGGSLPGSNGYYYDPAQGTLTNADDNTGSGDPGWQPHNGGMTNGQGYASTGAGLASFTGVANNADVTYSVNNPTGSISGSSNFNLIGNPYPSAISADLFIAQNGPVAAGGSGRLAGGLYFWDDDNTGGSGYNTNDYAVWTRTGATAGSGSPSALGTSPIGSVATGQGFKVEAVSSGIITFTNAMRGGNNTQFFKLEEEQQVDRLWLNLTGNTHFNQILVAFRDDATEERDLLYDAYKVRGNANISLGAVQQDKDYSIVAFPSLTPERTVPLMTYVSQADTYTFSADSIEGFEGYTVYLEDLQNGQLHVLQQDGSVNVQMGPQDEYGRFQLRFSPELVTEIEDGSTQQVSRIISSEMGLQVLMAAGVSTNGELRLFNAMGQLLLSQHVRVDAGRSSLLDVSALPAGIYVAAFQSSQGMVNAKVVLR